VRVRFGAFRLDTDRRELSRGSESIRLTPKAFQLLQLLTEARPKAVSQKELHDTLWPDTFVDDGSLHNLIYQLRQALDDAGHETIRTVYGFGFSFNASGVSENASAVAQCLLTIGDEDFTLREGENVIGRDWDAAVRIDAPSLSRKHARIVVESGRATIEDLGSKNGTSVDGRRLRSPRELSDGDQILFGSVAAKFRLLPTPPSTE
jgi:DNA-binding winged helix-turn-helix (wHTH) protein